MSDRRPSLRHRVEYAAGRGVLALVNLLPEGVAYWLCGAVGRLFYRCSRRRQRLSLHILRNAFPDAGAAELRRIAVRAAGNMFKVVLDTIRVVPLIAKGRLRDRVELQLDGDELPKPPFVGITGHLGSWEVGAIATASVCGESHVIVRGFKNPLLNDFILRNRRLAGMHVHPKRGGMRGVMRAMRDGKIGMQACDQNQRMRGAFVPFFGQLASTNRSAATLALRLEVPIVLGYATRAGRGFRFLLHLEEPFRLESTGDFEADVVEGTAEINRRLERAVLRYPEQYLWMHDRYRTKPDR